MRKNSLIILAVVTGFAVAIAGFLVQSREDAVIKEVAEGAALFPGLTDRINDVTEIEIRNTDGVITAVLQDGTWVIKEKGGYPAKLDKIRELMIGVARARILEERTSKPEYYSRLQVEDIDTPDAKSGQVLMRNANGDQLAGLVIGKRRLRGQFGAGTDDLYVRRVGEAQSVLANDIPSVLGGLNQWLDRDLVNVNRNRVRSVTNTRPEGDLLVVRRSSPEAADLTVEDLPRGAKADQFRTNDMGSALEFLILDDVRPAAEVIGQPTDGFSRYETFDGMIIDITVHSTPGADGKSERWLVLDAGFNPAGVAAEAESPPADPATPDAEGALMDPENVKQRAQDLAARFKGWAYKVPDWKTDVFLRRQAELIDREKSSGS